MLNREDIFLLFSACTITEIDSAECIHKRNISSWTDFTYFLICLTIIFPKKSFLASPYDGEKCNTKCYHLPGAHFRPILLVHSWAHQSYVCKYHLKFREKVRIWDGWKGSLRDKTPLCTDFIWNITWMHSSKHIPCANSEWFFLRSLCIQQS